MEQDPENGEWDGRIFGKEIFMRHQVLIRSLLIAGVLMFAGSTGFAAGAETLLVHLKTGLKHDDAQICVAYNAVWAALEEGLKVDVLIDADAAPTRSVFSERTTSRITSCPRICAKPWPAS